MNDYFLNIFKNVDSTIKLDQDQINAVKEEGNTIIIAGAGSGKTTTLTAKIKYLTEIKKINPKEILMISFTNKAVDELKERINEKFNIPVKITTFHKLSLDIIKKYKKVKILADNTQVIKQILINNKKDVNKYFGKCSKNYYQEANFMKEVINIKKELNIEIDKFSTNVLTEYQKYLEDENLIDFQDMIKEATKIVKEQKPDLKYKYIIIDEYQDISQNRFDLIKAINDLIKPILIVVGDDWQSIFAFAGSKINLFMKFKEIFNAKEYFIKTTYRNSQELIDIAGAFIQKNPYQIKKNLISSKSVKNPVIIKYYLKDKSKTIIKILKKNKNKKILILGRYNFDKKYLLKNKKIYEQENKIILKNNNIDITYLTVHSAKGLGFDEVIIINGDKGRYGFPSDIDKNMLDEERRLFYVALTRTKNKVYIITSLFNQSPFVKEIKKYCVKKWQATILVIENN